MSKEEHIPLQINKEITNPCTNQYGKPKQLEINKEAQKHLKDTIRKNQNHYK